MVHKGDRVLIRERPWRVDGIASIAGERQALQLAALDDDAPRTLSVVSPPEIVETLPSEKLRLERRGLESLTAWSLSHRILDLTAIRETGLLSGARWGRVRIETYQLAPALRVLSKPRPSLLVADDVGLGKTIEAGLAMLELMARGRARRVLVVLPPGLLLQWRDELLEKFGLEFALIENATGLARAQTTLPAGVSPWDALPRVLTSIDYLKKETVRSRALRKRWDLAIVDEAHALAESGSPGNPYSTQRTRLGLALRDAARGLLLLTATPHNGYPHSFRSLLELVEPSRATLRGDLGRVRKRVEHAVVRRMKKQIRRSTNDGTEQEVFPAREVRGIPVRPDAHYLEILRKVASYCSRTAKQAGGTEDEDLVGFAMQIVKKRALSSRRALEETIAHRLEALRKEEAREEPPDRSELRDLQADLPLSEIRAERTTRRLLRSAIPKEERRRKAEVRALNAIRRELNKSGAVDPKIEALLAEIRAVLAEDPTEKLIVFTEYLDTLESLRETLDASTDLADRYVVLRGGLSPRQRQARQQDFEKAEVRLLLATDAASEGLNLQRLCRRVVHLELPWNPNRLEQRNGRVDRYGQTRPPRIRYLFFPDSAEEDVLDQLVRKIETMAQDRLSTPDILGVLAGAGETERGLTLLDPESQDLEHSKASLVRHFEDRTAQFVRDVQPLLGSTSAGGPAQEDLQRLLSSAEPFLPEDDELERVVVGLLGPAAVKPGPAEGLHRIEVPLAHRGPGVRTVYPAATFSRELAVRHRPEEVDYLTPIHPLVRAVAADARRRLLLVHTGGRGLAPRRLAARRDEDGEPPSALFTFLGTIRGGGGLVEEHVLPVRLAVDGRALGTPEENARLVREATAAGEVTWEEIEALFAARFDALVERAAEEAMRILSARAQALRQHRRAQAEHLRAELRTDLADRLREIQEAERRARGQIEEATGQALLFAQREGGSVSASTRKAAAESQAERRRQELDEYERVEEPAPPAALGALLLVPAGAAR